MLPSGRLAGTGQRRQPPVEPAGRAGQVEVPVVERERQAAEVGDSPASTGRPCPRRRARTAAPAGRRAGWAEEQDDSRRWGRSSAHPGRRTGCHPGSCSVPAVAVGQRDPSSRRARSRWRAPSRPAPRCRGRWRRRPRCRARASTGVGERPALTRRGWCLRSAATGDAVGLRRGARAGGVLDRPALDGPRAAADGGSVTVSTPRSCRTTSWPAQVGQGLPEVPAESSVTPFWYDASARRARGADGLHARVVVPPGPVEPHYPRCRPPLPLGQGEHAHREGEVERDQQVGRRSGAA